MSFTIVGVAGKALRLCAYVVPGYFFASYISDLASTVGSVIGFLAAGALEIGNIGAR